MSHIVPEIKSKGFKNILSKDALADVCYPGNPREATHEQVVALFKKLM